MANNNKKEGKCMFCGKKIKLQKPLLCEKVSCFKQYCRMYHNGQFRKQRREIERRKLEKKRREIPKK